VVRHSKDDPRRRRDQRDPRRFVSPFAFHAPLLWTSRCRAPKLPRQRSQGKRKAALLDGEADLSGKAKQDPRAARTRGALVHAFDRLFLSRGRRPAAAAEIAAEAAVGRSTFYEHFGSADALYLDALKRPLARLAEAAAGQGDPAALEPLLAHFWQQRRHARDTLNGRLRPQVASLFTDLVEARLDGATLAIAQRLAARTLAEAALAPLGAWLGGEAPASPADLASALCRSGAALRSALESTAPPR
jgi:AcrR family transcriptional regulator